MPEIYPDGKLNEDDEGACAIAVFTDKGRVVMSFEKSVHWIGMNVESAEALVRTLTVFIRQAKGHPTSEELDQEKAVEQAQEILDAQREWADPRRWRP